MSYETVTKLGYGIILTDQEACQIEDDDIEDYDEIDDTGCHLTQYGNQVSGGTGYALTVIESDQYSDWAEEVSVVVKDDWDTNLSRACESLKINKRQPSWLLISTYG